MKKILYFATIVLAVLAASCTKPKVDPAVTLSSGATATVPTEGDVVTITFTTNVPWTAKSSESWLTVSPSSGEAGEKITIKASALKNETNDDRQATVTITAETATAQVTVTQSQLDALNVDTTADYVVEAEGGTVAIPVSANVDYSVSVPEAIDWIHVTSTKAMVDSKVTLTVDPTHEYAFNDAGELDPETIVRSANITISYGSMEQVVKVGQKTFLPYFDYQGDWADIQWSFYWGGPTVIPQEGADITIDVATNLDWRVFFSVWDNDQGAMVDSWDLGWAHLSYDVEKSQIHLVVDANETYVPRENYLYAECSIDGVVSSDFGGLGFFRQDGLVPSAGATVLWTKLLSEIGVPSAPYHRLAYKTFNGDALLISDGEKVHALSPEDGTYWKAITWGIKPTSICSDDAGNVIVAPDYPFESGSTYSVYYTQDVNQEPVKLFDHTADFSGTIGGWRVRGDISDRAVVTGFVGGTRYWAGWEIDKKEVSMDNYYAQATGGQARGPIAVDADAWSPESGAVMSLGPRLNEGIAYRAYDTDQRLYYLADAYTPNWLTPYNWQMVSEAGAGGNECQNNMDIIDYNGRRIMAYTQGLYWGYGGNASVYVLDVTNPASAEVIAILDGSELASVDSYAIAEDYGWATLNAYVSADVKFHIDPSLGLVLYVVNSTLESLSKVMVVF